jgi:prepilin-type N-terminal cleavage/methylation domain-containing protein/prepilin-type processing-associated H-X9-DG protein
MKALRHKSGFTLIELLVVIAIIAILAAILFPVFARARENARRASCQSNLKQIGLGIVQYTQDYDEKFPVVWNGAGGGAYGMWIFIQPYLKSLQIYQCPSEKNAMDTNTAGSGYTDYSYNLTLGYDNATSVIRGLNMSALTQSALTVLACDSASSYADNYSAGCTGITYTCAAGKAVFDGAQFTGSTQRHLETQNYLFTDGHVKAYKGQDSTTSAAVYNYATPGSTCGSTPSYNTAPDLTRTCPLVI